MVAAVCAADPYPSSSSSSLVTQDLPDTAIRFYGTVPVLLGYNSSCAEAAKAAGAGRKAKRAPASSKGGAKRSRKSATAADDDTGAGGSQVQQQGGDASSALQNSSSKSGGRRKKSAVSVGTAGSGSASLTADQLPSGTETS
jgi:hypothetical protein